jgi:hypothetical protein
MNGNNIIFRLHIPYWNEDEHPFTITGMDAEDTLQHITGYKKGSDEIVWDIDIENGVVLNWNGQKVDVFDKLRDGGTYELVDNGEVISHKNGYVPDFLYIGYGSGFGDYLQLSVDASGAIIGWDETHANDCLAMFGIFKADKQ